MLTHAQVANAFARFTYKPGWEFVVVWTPYEGTHLHIRCRLENAYRPGEMTDLQIESPLPPFADETAIEEWLIWRLSRIETHEVREWLKRDGEAIRNPHDGVVRT